METEDNIIAQNMHTTIMKLVLPLEEKSLIHTFILLYTAHLNFVDLLTSLINYSLKCHKINTPPLISITIYRTFSI